MGEQARHDQLIAEYVVGYFFKHNMRALYLVLKRHPQWQCGLYNGVGGKVEIGEMPAWTMSREFGEEARAVILPERWYSFRTEQFTQEQEHSREMVKAARVHHFVAQAKDQAEWESVRTQTDEAIVPIYYPLPAHLIPQMIYNLPYLVPMAAVLLQQPAHNRPQP